MTTEQRALKAQLVVAVLTGNPELPIKKIGLTKAHPINQALAVISQTESQPLPKPVNLDEVWALREKIAEAANHETAFSTYDRNIDPMHNHCKAASFVVQQKFGGVLLYARINGEAHYWNLLPCGEEVDITATQYDPPHKGNGITPIAEATHVLPYCDPKKANHRFRLLAKRVNSLLTPGVK